MSTIVWNDFSGGLWLPEQTKLVAPPNTLLRARDIIYEARGDGTHFIRGRRGVTNITIDTLGDIHLIATHYARSGTVTDIVWYNNGSNMVQQDSSASGIPFDWAATSGGFNGSLTYSPRGTSWPLKDALYFVNGADGLRKFNGSTLSEITLTGGSFSATSADIGPYIAVWRDRLWVTKADELTYSLYSSSPTSDSEFLGTNQLSLNDEYASTITGIVPYEDRLIILKDRGLWRFTGSTLSDGELVQYSRYGCIAPRSVQWTPYGVIYLARGGVRVTDGVDPTGVEISEPIRTVFTEPDTNAIWTTAVGFWYERRQEYWLCLQAGLDTSIYIAQLLQTKDGPRWAWRLFTAPTAFRTLHARSGVYDNDDILIVGDTAGRIWLYDAESTKVDNAATAITSTVQTQFLPMVDDSPARSIGSDDNFQLGRPYRVSVQMVSDVAITSTVRVSDGETTYDTNVSLGAATGGAPKFQYSTAPMFAQGVTGRLVSVIIPFAADGYENELHEVRLQCAVRGSRIHRKL